MLITPHEIIKTIITMVFDKLDANKKGCGSLAANESKRRNRPFTHISNDTLHASLDTVAFKKGGLLNNQSDRVVSYFVFEADTVIKSHLKAFEKPHACVFTQLGDTSIAI
ncbi:hypothetical protein TcCL_Unassigned03215 [Trypanosoma cruzi]|nr:hypothetical protein TcCL_Unassigned03215 [Trypanosoma cruzi]